MLPPRLRRLPRAPLTLPAPFDGLDVRRADDRLARLVGLAGLRTPPAGVALLLPRTRSIHTCFMRFRLDLLWLDREGRVVRVDRAVGPGRVRVCPTAHAVAEVPYCSRLAASR